MKLLQPTSFLGRKLKKLMIDLQDQPNHSYLNPYTMLLIFILQRLNFIFELSHFAGSTYSDVRLEILRNLVGWFTLRTPLFTITQSDQATITTIFATAYWLLIFLFLTSSKQFTVFRTMIRTCFTLFHTVLIVPSSYYIGLTLEDQNYLLFAMSLIPQLIISFLYYYICRNYSIPVINLLNRRYSKISIFYLILDQAFVISITITHVPFYQSLLTAVWILFIEIDSISNVNYEFYINKFYVFSCGFLFGASIINLISFRLDQDTAFYSLMLFLPLLSLVQLQIYEQKTQNYLFFGRLEQQRIIFLSDIILSEETLPIQSDILLSFLRNQYRIEIKKKQSIYIQKKYIINRLFDHYLNSQPEQSRFANEDILLYKVLFLAESCKKFELGYINLKKIETSNKKLSLYFILWVSILTKKIKKSELLHKNKDQMRYEVNEKISLQTIRESEILQVEAMDIIMRIIDLKIKFWIQMLVGYKNIESYAGQTIQISEHIWLLKELVFSKLHINPALPIKNLNAFNILQLKLLSMIYSLILNDYHSTLEIETRVEELLNIDRNNTSDSIHNLVLIRDELILINAGLLKKRGQILNKNRVSMASFFGYNDEKDFAEIQFINQLMPKFIASLHNEFINDYIKSGHSKLFDKFQQSFYVAESGFIKACNFSLIHQYEQSDDYIVTGAIQKCKQSSDFLVFDGNGKILGLSEYVYINLFGNECNRPDYKQILEKAYIYFWFHNIVELLQSQDKEFSQSQQYLRVLPLFQVKDYLNCLRQNAIFRKQNNWSSSQFSVGAQKKGESEERFTELTQDFDTKYGALELIQKEKLNQFIDSLISQELIDEHASHDVRFQFSIQVLGKQEHHIFVMEVFEITKKRKNSKMGQTYSSSVYVHSHKIEEESESMKNNITEMLNEIEIHTIVNKMVLIKPEVGNQKDQVSFINSSNLGASQFKQENESKDFRVQEDKYESHLISPRENYQKPIIAEEEESEGMQFQQVIDKSSTPCEVKEDVLKVIQMNKENFDHPEKYQRKQSQASSTSDNTQTYIYNLLRSLSQTKRFQSTILKALFISISLFFVCVALVTIELYLQRKCVEFLEFEIPLVRVPDKFNRLYCTFVTLVQMDLQQQLLNYQFSPYYQYRIEEQSKLARKEMQELISHLKKELTIFEESGLISQITIRQNNQFHFSEETSSMTHFWTMVNEATQQLNVHLALESPNLFDEVVIAQFLKDNLMSQLLLTQQLVESIRTEFFQTIEDNQFNQMIIFVVSLLITFVMIAAQFRFWQEPYFYKQNILLLLSRVSESDIDTMIARFRYYKDKFSQNSNSWKQVNYFKDIYSFNQRKTQQSRTVSQSNNPNVKKYQKAKSTSRVQETTFNLWHIYLLLFVLWSIITSYEIAAFIYQAQLVKEAKPELDLCMTFVLFKSDFDGAMILSQLLKNERILNPAIVSTGVFQRNSKFSKSSTYFDDLLSEMLIYFHELYQGAKEGYNLIYKDIISSSRLSPQNQNLLLGLYQDDFCVYLRDQLPFCDYHNQVFAQFPEYPHAFETDNNRENFKHGLNGIVQRIISLFETAYVNELNSVQDDNLSQLRLFVSSPEYLTDIVSYYFDVNKAVVEFYTTIIQASLEILANDFKSQLTFTLAYFLVSFLLFFSIISWRTISLQRQLRAIRQALIMLPHETLLDPQTSNAIKKFEKGI